MSHWLASRDLFLAMSSNFIKMANCFGEDCWQNAFCSIENLFGIEALFLEQKEAIKAFILHEKASYKYMAAELLFVRWTEVQY